MMHRIWLNQPEAQLHCTLHVVSTLDTSKASVFVQSHVRAHVELIWLLSSAAPLGWLNKMIQFKEKSRKAGDENVAVALLTYPVLMTLDILLYQDKVEVGASILRQGRRVMVISVDFRNKTTQKLLYTSRTTVYIMPLAWKNTLADIVLRGYSGYNTRWARKILNQIMEEMSRPPAAVIVFLGTNDAALSDRSCGYQHVPISEFKDNIQSICTSIKEKWPSPI